MKLMESSNHLIHGIVLTTSAIALAVMQFILPIAAPIALGAYAIYNLKNKDFVEGGLALGVAILLWLLRDQVQWLFWVVAAVMTGFGLFFILLVLFQSRK